MPLTPRLHDWLEMRGITPSDDADFLRLVPWLRTTYALCSALTAIGTLFAFTPLLWALVVLAGLGAIFPIHPFDTVYNYGIRRLTRTRPLPRNAAPTRFACGLAAVWLAVTAAAFDADVAWLGYVLGASLAAVAGLAALSHFCTPSFMYQMLAGDRALALRALARWRSADQ